MLDLFKLLELLEAFRQIGSCLFYLVKLEVSIMLSIAKYH